MASLTKAYTPTPKGNLDIVNVDVNTNGRRIPARIYHKPLSNKATKPGVLFFIHGGGHLSGSVGVYDPIARNLALATGDIVVAVDYRLAPENPYPAGLNDARAVLLQTYSLLDSQHIAYQHNLTLAGDSGGGAFSATLAAEFQTSHAGFINQLVLIYPSLDYTLAWPSLKENGTGKLLDETKISWYFDQYFQNKEDRREHSPLYMPITKAYPKVLLFTGGLDPLRDEDFAYAARLKAAGVPVQHQHFPTVTHAYLMIQNLVPKEVQTTYQLIGEFVVHNSTQTSAK
ncbi:alpha/beta hydrolase [Vibrio algicola]|uniref:alpha/beta hydrolase n=1 Tax=Vibrio algicola TaxID=2662262 RepID=UPI0015B5CE8D|nr:alpha/beta hydrolase [Vibrio algicola]